MTVSSTSSADRAAAARVGMRRADRRVASAVEEREAGGWSFTALGATFTLQEPRLFFRKTTTVFALALLLLPLVRMKSQLPALGYVGALLLLHIVVLGLYLYRTRLGSLDADRRSLFARVAAIAFITYLLFVVSRATASSALSWPLAQVVVASALHTGLLLLLMLRVRFAGVDEPE